MKKYRSRAKCPTWRRPQQHAYIVPRDSITDASRNRAEPDDLGDGYVSYIAPMFNVRFPQIAVKIINRGVGGNRVAEMQTRWQQDCIDLQPDVVSIMIGVNDYHPANGRNRYTLPEKFEASYRDVIEKALALTRAKIIMMEPFMLPLNEDTISRLEDHGIKAGIVRKLADEYEIPLILLNDVLAKFCTNKPMEYWSTDGVHPSRAGHVLIAEKWMEKFFSSRYYLFESGQSY